METVSSIVILLQGEATLPIINISAFIFLILKLFILTQLKTFPNFFQSLLEYSFDMAHAEVLIKTVIT